jgi:hypothetical protein
MNGLGQVIGLSVGAMWGNGAMGEERSPGTTIPQAQPELGRKLQLLHTARPQEPRFPITFVALL